MEKAVIDNLRDSIQAQVGNRVKVKINRGRHRIEVSEGIIREAYSSVFVVEFDKKKDEDKPKRVSFSYIDVITKEVQMMLI